MTLDDFPAVARLVHRSTNQWYTRHTGKPIFTCKPDDCLLFPQVYHDLDPGQAVVIEDPDAGRLAGSCFIHPRETHIALGIMNADPDYAGRGVARCLLRHVTDLADERGLPTRLISSAMNLDSFSLYNRAGFVPTAVYQDMIVIIPPDGLVLSPAAIDTSADPIPSVRPATLEDLPAIDALDQKFAGITRPNDWCYFITNTAGHWHCAVAESRNGQLVGVLASIRHPATCIVGPGVMHDDSTALALLHHHLNQHHNQTMLVIAPANRPVITHQLYTWGARNCELHITQLRPPAGMPAQQHTHTPIPSGILFPTFMPETG